MKAIAIILFIVGAVLIAHGFLQVYGVNLPFPQKLYIELTPIMPRNGEVYSKIDRVSVTVVPGSLVSISSVQYRDSVLGEWVYLGRDMTNPFYWYADLSTPITVEGTHDFLFWGVEDMGLVWEAAGSYTINSWVETPWFVYYEMAAGLGCVVGAVLLQRRQ